MHMELDFPSAGIALDWKRGWRVFSHFNDCICHRSQSIHNYCKFV